MDVILTAAITANGKIAHHSNEIVSWSKDLQLFREQTIGQTVIMGSRTAKTLADDLENRETMVVHRTMSPEEVLKQIKTERCFIIGGSRTYTRFAPYITHVFLTYHPLIFSSNSLPLFFELKRDLFLKFVDKIEVDAPNGIYQFQYKVMRDG